MIQRNIAAVAVLLLTQLAPHLFAQSEPTRIFFVRHGETDRSTSERHLNEIGRQRAALLMDTLRDVPLTHIYSSHTNRTFETVLPTAQSKSMGVVRAPGIGTEMGGVEITGSAASILAAEPLTQQLRILPEGSSALVAGNSDNLYAIMAGLGARVGEGDSPCEEGHSCIPCETVSCFPSTMHDRMWLLIIGVEGTRGPILTYWSYGRPD